MTRGSATARCGAVAVAAILGATTPSPGAALQQPAPGDPTPDLSALAWRELGPAVTSGRIVAFAVHPLDRDVIYAGSASGGAWKTTDAGTTWEPVFDDQRTVSLGAIALDPNDPEVVWVGTGEQNSVRSSSFGDGVYRSDDGGSSWRHMGLTSSRHIGRILVHPGNSDVVYVAAMGSLWGPGGERGLYRTRDGGASWERILEVDRYTGVVEVRMDPRDPDVLFAATFQRERRQWSMVGGGAGSALHRSDDGGDSWTRVRGGFPQEPLGRIGIAICPGAPEIMYASAVGPTGGIFRSDDGGRSWTRRNADLQSHWFYGELVCDPVEPERLYLPMTPLYVSEDGGRTFRNLVRSDVHVDHHVLWVNPDDPEHLMVGNDGGVYTSHDRGESWRWHPNLPVMQLYTAGFDMQEPFYHVYGGTQDNGSWGGPVGTRYRDGVSNADWSFTVGGDGFFSRVDPTDADIVYAESQYGVLQRVDRATGERRRIQPWQPQDPDVPAWRWNWSAPLEISPHDPATLYFAANVVFRSRDRGDSWTVISPDLTRGLSRDSLPLQGRRQPSDAIDLHASTALYGNVATLALSPLAEGVVAAGTDDGLVQVSRDDGASWQRSATFPGVPEMMKVSGLAWSSTAAGTLYAVFDGHKDDDFRPHVVRSDDYGESWRNVTANLPAFGPTRSVAVHPRNGDLVFVGTEFGAFVSLNGGGSWMRLGTGLPTVAVHAIAVHPRENDIILGTHGRGFWILDDAGLLEALAALPAGTDAVLARPRAATLIRDANRGRGSVGDTRWTADNPPRGAILDAWFADSVSGRAVRLEILDESGTMIRGVTDTTAAPGSFRWVWDLRHAPPTGPDGRELRGVQGRFVLPGTYRVRMQVGDDALTRTLEVRRDPALAPTADEAVRRDAVVALQTRLLQAAAWLEGALDGLSARLAEAAATVDAAGGQAPSGLRTELAAIRDQAGSLLVRFRGPGGGGLAQQETVLPLTSLLRRLRGTTEDWSGPPTADQERLTRRAHLEMWRLAAEVRALVDDSLPGLQADLASAGLEWQAGPGPQLPDDLLPDPNR